MSRRDRPALTPAPRLAGVPVSSEEARDVPTVRSSPVSRGIAPAQAAAPRLDPNNTHGAWIGYSAGREASGERTSGQVPAGALAGMDVSGHQGQVDWPRAYADGARFAYVKATEGSGFRSSSYAQQFLGAAAVGMVRGAYHYAHPANDPIVELDR